MSSSHRIQSRCWRDRKSMTGTDLGPKALPIETERLILRKYLDRDLRDIVEFSRQADFWLARNLDWEPTHDSVRAHFEAQRDLEPESLPGWMDLVMEIKSEGRVIGCVGIGVTDKEQGQASIGWMLGCQYQGQGLATEAAQALVDFGFRAMKLHRIFARTGQANTRSWRLMERLGMRREAHFRQSHKVQGKWDDEFVYALLADEWEQICAGKKPATVP
jgi:RimJ/RimL family protein N-acetyltransferase